MALGLHLISRYSKNLLKNAIIQSGAPLFQELIPVTKNELTINSFIAIKKLGCLNLSSKSVLKHLGLLDDSTRSKYFDLKGGFSNEKSFYTELDKSFKKLAKKIKQRQTPFKSEELIDKNLLKVVKYLSKYAVDLECLRNLTPEQITSLDGSHNQVQWQMYYDFDFIDTGSYIDYKLFNKLNFNPNLNLLIGGVSGKI